LEIKLHFAAVAVPDKFDQDRGTDSSPFLESFRTALAHVSWRRGDQHRAVSGWIAKRERGALLLLSHTLCWGSFGSWFCWFYLL